MTQLKRLLKIGQDMFLEHGGIEISESEGINELAIAKGHTTIQVCMKVFVP